MRPYVLHETDRMRHAGATFGFRVGAVGVEFLDEFFVFGLLLGGE